MRQNLQIMLFIEKEFLGSANSPVIKYFFSSIDLVLGKPTLVLTELTQIKDVIDGRSLNNPAKSLYPEFRVPPNFQYSVVETSPSLRGQG